MTNVTNDKSIKLLKKYYPLIRNFRLNYETVSGKSSIFTMYELNNAFDHIYKANIAEDEKEVEKQIGSAEGHFIRALFDLLDITIIDKTDTLKSINDATLTQEGLENKYYALNMAKELVAIKRDTKDVFLLVDETNKLTSEIDKIMSNYHLGSYRVSSVELSRNYFKLAMKKNDFHYKLLLILIGVILGILTNLLLDMIFHI